MKTGNHIVDAIGGIHFEGRLVPHAWRRHPKLKTPAGKLYNCAIDLLADVVYWHRPTILLDEESSRAVSAKTKFEADRYRINYQKWADENGYSKRQAQDAAAFLKKQGICLVEVEDYKTPTGHIIYSAVFITPIVEMIKELNKIEDEDKGDRGVPKIREGGHENPRPVSHKSVTPIPEKRDSTKSTAKPSAKIPAKILTTTDDDAKIFDLTDALVTHGVSLRRAKQLAQDFPEEMQRRLEYLPHVQIKSTPAQYLSGSPEQEYSVPATLVKQRAAETRALLLEAQARAELLETQQKKQAADEAHAINEQLDSYYNSLAASEREEIDAQASERVVRVGGVKRSTPAALAIARRELLRAELGIAPEDDDDD